MLLRGVITINNKQMYLTIYRIDIQSSTNRKENMKAKNYKSITDILKKKYKKNFYDFEDFEDVLIKIRKGKK